MSNATSPAAPDHAAEYTRADNAIRLLIASFADWSAATGVAPERMRVAPVPERGELCILPGGLLGRVEGPAPEGRGIPRVSRWSDDGWRYFGLARESTLTVEGVEAHHHYSAALAAATTETDR